MSGFPAVGQPAAAPDFQILNPKEQGHGKNRFWRHVIEEVITADEFTLEPQALETLKNEVITILGYGVQGPGQALNLRDNGFPVIVGQREGGASWQRAVEDGFVPGKTLLPIESRGAQGHGGPVPAIGCRPGGLWPQVKQCLNAGDALYFSHGFSVVYKDQTGIVPPANVDVILVAPKGSGRTVRTNFLAGSGINSSFAGHQDFTGRARERALALGIAIGSGYLFPDDL
jgi:ketol-acid reductoisomerase